jgi:hypothetical protein
MMRRLSCFDWIYPTNGPDHGTSNESSCRGQQFLGMIMRYGRLPRPKPLEFGPLVRAQRYIVRHSATVLLTATMAPSPIVITTVITQIE